MKDRYFIGAAIPTALIWNVGYRLVAGKATGFSVAVAIVLLVVQIACLGLYVRAVKAGRY